MKKIKIGFPLIIKIFLLILISGLMFGCIWTGHHQSDPGDNGSVSLPEILPEKKLAFSEELAYPPNGKILMSRYLSELKKETKDAVGWIRIPGTEISFPIVQADDNTYYLRRDYLANHSRPGCIFMDYRNDSSQLSDKNTILYGHNMNDARKFGKLMPFKDPSYIEDRPYIELVTDAGYSIWQIFSAHVTSRDFYYIYTRFPSDEVFHDFVLTLKEKSMHSLDVEVSSDDQILTLSTCSYEFRDAYFAVHAVQIHLLDLADSPRSDKQPTLK